MTTKICRLCLSYQNEMCNIFTHKNKNLVNIIFEFTTIEILKTSKLPHYVCLCCIETVMQYDVFKKQCQHSEHLLQQEYVKAEDGSNKCADISNTHLHLMPNYALQNNTNVDKIDRAVFVQLEHVSSFVKPNSKDSDTTYINISHIKNKHKKEKKCVTKTTTDIMLENTLIPENHCDVLELRDEDNIDETVKKIIGTNVYQCDICTIKFYSFFDYYDHQETHNGQAIFKCHKCIEIFNTREDLVQHDLRHKISCRICKTEVLPTSMKAHLLIHTDIHKCSCCGIRTTSKASLEKHIKARHIGVKEFVCYICGKQSSCQSSMKRHMGYHSTERPYKCKYCDFCAKSLNIVQVHTSRKHSAEKCVCEICAKLFKSRPSLIQHMKRIHAIPKHNCNICGKSFIERYNLNRHLKKHIQQRLHECKICHSEFFTVRLLKEHMHSHRQGCVNCSTCGKEFFYKKYYAKHVISCTTNKDIQNNFKKQF